MNPVEIIRKKRNGLELSQEELKFFLEEYLSGGIADYHMSAFLMAIYFSGMNFGEITSLTDVMLRSGVVIDLSDIPGIKVDKHSTGGVGDKVSLILAPMVAACGVPVPMISGRGLGHTGGTLDKLESIPGFRTDLSLTEYRAVLRDVGAVMIGQTSEIAPADKRIYALRDVTATVESIPLIAASIMSKKLAEGIDALVLDIKTGTGAFMPTEERAVELAQTLIAVGERFSKKTVGLLTDMSQPLGYAIGNWCEVRECIECMQGRDIPDLLEITCSLGGVMLLAGGKARNMQDGIQRCRQAISSGAAMAKFSQMVAAQSGDTAFLGTPSQYPRSRYSREITASSTGFVSAIDALEAGLVAVSLGAGRMSVDAAVDPKAGITLRKKVGEPVVTGEPVAVLYTDKETMLEKAAERLAEAFRYSPGPITPPRLIRSLIDGSGVHPWGA